MAKLKVSTSTGDVASYEGRYWVDEGVLTVQPNEGNKILFGPTGWLALEVVEADPPVA